MEQAHCRSLPVQVTSTSLQLPIGEHVDLVLMDYRYSSSLTTADIVVSVKTSFPGTPIAVLSELYGMPQDMKAQPSHLSAKVSPRSW